MTVRTLLVASVLAAALPTVSGRAAFGQGATSAQAPLDAQHRRPAPREVRAFELETLVVTGDLAPDGNGTFASLWFPPVQNEHGVVTMVARYADTGDGPVDDEAVLRWSRARGLEVVLREGDLAPDGVGFYGAHFPLQSAFFWPSINARGEVATRASYHSALPLDEGLVRTDGVLVPGLGERSIARAGDALPGGGVIEFFRVGVLPIDDAGRTAVLIATSGGDAFWRCADQPELELAALADPAPDGDGTITGFDFGWATLDAAGRVAFVASLEDAGGAAGSGLVLASGATSALLAREERPFGPWLLDDVDGGGGSIRPCFDGTGGVVFADFLLDPDHPHHVTVGSGAFRVDGDGPDFVATTLAPVVAGGDTPTGFLWPQARAGHVAGTVTFASVAGTVTDVGLVVRNGSATEVLLRTGSSLPGATLSGGITVGATLALPQVGSGGEVAVVGLADTPSGQDAFLAWREPDRAPRTVLATGMGLEGRAVAGLELPHIPDPGGHGAIAADGSVVFVAHLADGAVAVVVARPVRRLAPASNPF